MAGDVSVTIPAEDGSARRLATLQPGMIFGEAAVLGRAKRTADVIADVPSRLLTLSAATFEDLGRTDPALQAALLHNPLRGAYETVDRLTREVARSAARAEAPYSSEARTFSTPACASRAAVTGSV